MRGKRKRKKERENKERKEKEKKKKGRERSGREITTTRTTRLTLPLKQTDCKRWHSKASSLFVEVITRRRRWHS